MAKKGTRSSTTKAAKTAKTKQTKSTPRAGGAAKSKSRKASKPAPTLSYEQIAARAEQIWREKGCPAGHDEQNWHEAERQLREELGS